MEATNPRETLYRWLLAVGCFALLTFFFSPPWAAFSYWSRVPELGGMVEVRRAVSVLEQVQHPGAPLQDPLHGAIQWRLLFPLIGRALNLPPAALLGLAHVGCLLVLAFIVTVLRRDGVAWTRCALATAMLGAGGWFFASMGWLGYYDSWFVLALLFVAFADARWPVWLACLWAPWIDERLVMAVPLALLCRYLERTRGGEAFDWKREFGPPAALLLAFVAVRLGVLGGRSGPNATPGGYLAKFNVLNTPLPRVLDGAWMGLRAGWLFVVAGVGLLSGRQTNRGLLLGGVALATMLVGLGTAQDFSRSMMLLMPAALFGALVLARENPRWHPAALAVGAGAALVLPAKQVVSDGVHPIFYLYHQLDAFEHPPAAVMPEFFELQAIRAMQEGRTAQAEANLAMAIKLANNPAPAAKQRGVLRASQGRWKDAAEDFALMAKYEPANPDAWFMCAQSALALGDVANARTNMQQAVSRAPADWITRPDVARFQSRLDTAR